MDSRQDHGKKRRRIRPPVLLPPAWLIPAGLWLVASVAPYAMAGKDWGMVWFLLNLPLSRALKVSLWGLGIPAYVAIVSAINFVILAALTFFVSRIFTRR